MPTRHELHALVDTLPDEAMEAAHRILSRLQAWPSPPAPDVHEMRKRVELRRREMRRGQKPGTIVERIRIEGPRLFYKHEVLGPGGTREEREVIFDFEESHGQ